MPSIISACEREIPPAFRFLIDEFGFTPGRHQVIPDSREGECSYEYTSRTLRIKPGWDWSDYLLLVGPPSAVVPRDYCTLEEILAVVNPGRVPAYGTIDRFDLAKRIVVSARLLRDECAKLLRGDVQILRAAEERARTSRP